MGKRIDRSENGKMAEYGGMKCDARTEKRDYKDFAIGEARNAKRTLDN